MRRRQFEAGGLEPVTTTGFDGEEYVKRLLGRFRIHKRRMLVDPGMSQIEHFHHQRQIFTSERRRVLPLFTLLVQW